MFKTLSAGLRPLKLIINLHVKIHVTHIFFSVQSYALSVGHYIMCYSEQHLYYSVNIHDTARAREKAQLKNDGQNSREFPAIFMTFPWGISIRESLSFYQS